MTHPENTTRPFASQRLNPRLSYPAHPWRASIWGSHTLPSRTPPESPAAPVWDSRVSLGGRGSLAVREFTVLLDWKDPQAAGEQGRGNARF